jgi:hypothetical protein
MACSSCVARRVAPYTSSPVASTPIMPNKGAQSSCPPAFHEPFQRVTNGRTGTENILRIFSTCDQREDRDWEYSEFQQQVNEKYEKWLALPRNLVIKDGSESEAYPLPSSRLGSSSMYVSIFQQHSVSSTLETLQAHGFYTMSGLLIDGGAMWKHTRFMWIRLAPLKWVPTALVQTGVLSSSSATPIWKP